jgi:hypothetical protein
VNEFEQPLDDSEKLSSDGLSVVEIFIHYGEGRKASKEKRTHTKNLWFPNKRSLLLKPVLAVTPVMRDMCIGVLSLPKPCF